MNYFELDLIINPCNDISREILSAKLSELGFEGFLETETGIIAYILSKDFAVTKTDYLLCQLKKNNIQTSYTIKEILPQNWNAAWEKNIQPIIIGDICAIKTPSHKNVPATKYEILIEPKMSFGTGHHETTSLMVEEMLHTDFSGKNVLDMGCGTGILAILASKLGAKNILAIDNDSWAYNNSLENIQLNNISNICVSIGTSELLGEETFDVILVNIAKNIILNDSKKYASVLKNNGVLLCSGFYENDKEDIQTEMLKNELIFVDYRVKNNWTILRFTKK